MAYTQTKSYAPLLSDKVRILVVGDMSVGKTSLVNLICEGKVLQNPNWTIGCKAEVKLHDYKGKPFFVEFLDVGGSPKHENSRSIFYSQFNGVILAHDLTNRKSYINLKRWIKEILNAVSPSDRTKWSIKNEKHMLELQHEDQNNFYPIPIMVVANKLDLVRPDSTSYLNNDDLGTESVLVSAWDQSSFGPNTPSGYSLDSFLNRTISNALAPRSKGVKINAPSSPDMSRRRSGSFDRLQRLGLKYDLKRKDLDPSRLKGGELYSDDSTPDPSPRDLRSLSPRDLIQLWLVVKSAQAPTTTEKGYTNDFEESTEYVLESTLFNLMDEVLHHEFQLHEVPPVVLPAEVLSFPKMTTSSLSARPGT